MLELDTHLTADEQVVVAHDVDLHRICHDSRLIREVNYEVLLLFLKHAFSAHFLFL